MTTEGGQSSKCLPAGLHKAQCSDIGRLLQTHNSSLKAGRALSCHRVRPSAKLHALAQRDPVEARVQIGVCHQPVGKSPRNCHLPMHVR